MLENIWTEYLKEQLADQLRSYTPTNRLYETLPDRWIAMSLLQKAIRRGDEVQALRAGQCLLNADYRTFWRRLVVIAWEDVSFGDFDLCGMITAASGSKRWRSKLGGDWRVASYLTSALCRAQKNRVTDDLPTIIEHEVSLDDIRDELGSTGTQDLQGLVSQTDLSVYHRTIAAWYLLGTDKFGSDVLIRRPGDVDAFFETFDIHLCPEHVLAVCRIAVSRSGTILPAIVPLLWSSWRSVDIPMPSISDTTPKEPFLNTIPRYAFDGNTRTGRRYLYWLVEQSSNLTQYLTDAISFADRKVLLRKLYFRTHSSLCANRQVWLISDDIRIHADQIGLGLDTKTINEGKSILNTALIAHPMTEAHL